MFSGPVKYLKSAFLTPKVVVLGLFGAMFLSDIDLCRHVVLVRPNAPMPLEENKLFIEKSVL
jgi:hypothetical protein